MSDDTPLPEKPPASRPPRRKRYVESPAERWVVRVLNVIAVLTILAVVAVLALFSVCMFSLSGMH